MTKSNFNALVFYMNIINDNNSRIFRNQIKRVMYKCVLKTIASGVKFIN